MSRVSRTIWHNPALTVPAMVAVLMIAVAALVSKVVLGRLNETQTEHFQALTGAYLDGLSTAVKPYLLRRDPWEAFDVLDRARTRYAGLDSKTVLVVLSDETVLAASDPRMHLVFEPALAASRKDVAPLDLGRAAGTVWIHRDIVDGGVKIGRIAAEIDVHKQQEERWQAILTLILFNSALTATFVVLGWLLVRRLMKPLTRLSDLLARSVDGTLQPLGKSELPPAETEVGQAYRHYNVAAAAVAEREALLQRLAEQERRALMGQFASAMAHEVNNPLGGMLNALRMIQRHGDDRELREGATTLLQRGLIGIQNVVRASLMTWRGDTDGKPLTPSDMDDIHYLVQSEASRRELTLDWSVDFDASLDVPGQAVRQIALNLLLNACAASQPGKRVHFTASLGMSELHLRVADEGPGIPVEARQTLLGETPEKVSATGLGLWATSLLIKKLGGSIKIDGPPGSTIVVTLPLAIPIREKAVA
jgi:signal transduction histidine kinase